MRRTCFAVVLGFGLLPNPHAASDEKHRASKNEWAEQREPLEGAGEAIGEYSAGCLIGAVPVAKTGRGFQVVRLKRRRRYAHPAMRRFLYRLARASRRRGMAPLIFGDVSQPRGGPAPSGHTSHQNGLDADIWYSSPPQAAKRALTRKERKTLEPEEMVDLKSRALTDHWSQRVPRLLALAARDGSVARVFVNPTIKKTLCGTVKGDRSWLRKIRPWYGHHRHFHVRLHCPKKSSRCVEQKPLPPGDGCDQLAWWFDEKAQAERAEKMEAYQQSTKKSRPLPDACTGLIEPGANGNSDRDP